MWDLLLKTYICDELECGVVNNRLVESDVREQSLKDEAIIVAITGKELQNAIVALGQGIGKSCLGDVLAVVLFDVAKLGGECNSEICGIGGLEIFAEERRKYLGSVEALKIDLIGEFMNEIVLDRLIRRRF